MDKNKTIHNETNSLSHNTQEYNIAVRAIKSVILKSRYNAAKLVNKELLSLYYTVGEYISKRSRVVQWGTNALSVISHQLQQELSGLRGFSVTNLKRMRTFYEAWDEENIFRPLMSDEIEIVAQDSIPSKRPMETDVLKNHTIDNFCDISFSHHYEVILHTSSLEERKYYIQKCATEFWTVEKLRYNLKSNLYSSEGAMVSNFNSTIKNIDFGKAAIKSFKDEYLLDFVNIEDVDEIDERVLEHEIVLNIKKFIMALGSDFSFLGNQYRLIVDEKEYFLDLLFFNRRLQSLVVIELKRGEFKPEYAGKMNFYLSALDEYVKMPHENPSIGIILCKSQSQKIVEFAFKDTSKPMGVAVYKLASELPEKYKDILPNPDMLRELL